MLKIIDRESGSLVLRLDVLEGEKQYPFEFYIPDTGDLYLSSLEAEELYDYLGRFFGPKDITNE